MNYLLLMGSADLTLSDVTLITGVSRATVKAIAKEPEKYEGKLNYHKVTAFFELVKVALDAGKLPIPRRRGHFDDRRKLIMEAVGL